MQADSFLIANAAEVQNGLLYMLGAGWTRTWPNPGAKYPLEMNLVVATLIRVGWNETNQRHSFEIRALDEDEQPVGQPTSGGFQVGKPADLTRGMSQLLALGGAQKVTLKSPAIYHLTLSIDGTELSRIEFEALATRPGGAPAEAEDQ